MVGEVSGKHIGWQTPRNDTGRERAVGQGNFSLFCVLCWGKAAIGSVFYQTVKLLSGQNFPPPRPNPLWMPQIQAIPLCTSPLFTPGLLAYKHATHGTAPLAGPEPQAETNPGATSPTEDRHEQAHF
jgi:hypothetical protein